MELLYPLGTIYYTLYPLGNNFDNKSLYYTLSGLFYYYNNNGRVYNNKKYQWIILFPT
jgi:hypothetical protein